MVPAFAAKTAATAGGADYAPKDAAVDAEVIEMVMTFFARLKLDGVQLEINSIGHAAEELPARVCAEVEGGAGGGEGAVGAGQSTAD